MKNKFYVTTPIYYATAAPHLGSLYSTLLADVAARWNKLNGADVFFLTGTDEHGQKIEQAAIKAGKNPKEFVDSFIDAYKDAWKSYNIDYTKFIRTTDFEHIKAVQEWLKLLISNGEIYKGKYEGMYCTPCETFVAEGSEQIDCVSCGRACIFVSEEAYFFKLSSYQDKLLQFYKNNPNFVYPKARLNEVIKFVEGGLKDLCISRTTVKWGIPFPGDAAHVTYVWADALNNYVTAVKDNLEKWWPADLQILGKDIFRFHAVYWPAFLMASNLSMPKHLLVHGWIKIADKKMSKSLGNAVDPIELKDKFGVDEVRYYLVSQMAVTQDSEFSIYGLKDHISKDLANDLGNLLNRTVTLALNNNLKEVNFSGKLSKESEKLKISLSEHVKIFREYMDLASFHMAMAELWKFISEVNLYFHVQEPWKIVKVNQDQFTETIFVTCCSLQSIANLLWCVMPTKMEELLNRIGCSLDINTLENWNDSFKLSSGPTLFIKYDLKEELLEIKESEEKVEEQYITIDDFAKVEICAGTIIECEEVPKSDKLLKMQVDFGDKGIKQIFAGMKQFYKPEDLMGKQGIFVVNLAPRKMMGMESQGMMLAADSEHGPVRIIPAANVINGSRLK